MYKIRNKVKYILKNKPIVIALTVIVVTCIGVYLLLLTQAAVPTASIQSENGTITAPAIKTDNSTASNAAAVQFKKIATDPVNGGCAVSGVSAPCIGGLTTGASNWGTPVFFDEFNGTTLDLNKWSPCWFPGSFNGSDSCGMMNDSITNKTNVRIENGSVVLRQSSVIENSANDAGALINTDPSQVGSGKGFSFGAGYFAEARVYFPGNGRYCYNWPAWWSNGPISGYKDGEIDIAEVLGSGTMHSNYHYDRGSGHQTTSYESPVYWCDTYHIYGVDRQNGLNIIYFDGKEVTRYTSYDNGALQYLVFNVGYETGKTPMSGSASDVRVDYVRVWKK